MPCCLHSKSDCIHTADSRERSQHIDHNADSREHYNHTDYLLEPISLSLRDCVMLFEVGFRLFQGSVAKLTAPSKTKSPPSFQSSLGEGTIFQLPDPSFNHDHSASKPSVCACLSVHYRLRAVPCIHKGIWLAKGSLSSLN